MLAAAAEDQGATKIQRIPGAFRPAAEDRDAAQVRPIPDAFLPVAEPRPSQALPIPADPAEPAPGGGRRAGAKVIRFPRWHGHGRLAAVAGAVAAAIIAVLVIMPGQGHGLPANAVTFKLAALSGQTASGTATDVQDASGSWDITLSVQHLTNLGNDDYYECWYVSPASPGRPKHFVSAGTFAVEDNGSGTFSMTSGVDPRQYSTMEIIAESPGTTGPQGPVILSGAARA